MRLLLVEDDEKLAAGLSQRLHRQGYVVDCVADGNEAAFMGEIEPYDLMILDLNLPGLPGLEVLRQWRARGVHAPVLILTAKGAWHEKVDGFRAGADDYLVKPYHFEELLLRVRALIRRSHGMPGGRIEVGCLRLDEERQCVYRDGVETALTATEFRLLRYLMLHAGRVVSPGVLIEHLYGGTAEVESNIIEVYVSKLRKKLGRSIIRTRRGQGYILDASPPCAP